MRVRCWSTRPQVRLASSHTRRLWWWSTAARPRWPRRPRHSTSSASTTWPCVALPSGWRKCGCPTAKNQGSCRGQDGGPAQVAAAAKALHELGIDDMALCGLAKRLEEVWLPDVEEPVILPRTSEGLYLLQRLRDEAHRFAITHHRVRRSKSMVESVLEQVPGLGEVRRKALISYFGSLKKLRAATVE